MYAVTRNEAHTTTPGSDGELLLGSSAVSLEEWERRKKFVGFTGEDARLLATLRPMAEKHVHGIVEELYRRWMEFEEMRAFFKDPLLMSRVKEGQKRYFIELTAGEYGAAYLASRLRIGLLHKRIGLEPRWYVGAYSIYTELVFPRVVDTFFPDFARARRTFIALLKIMMLDQELAITSYISGA